MKRKGSGHGLSLLDRLAYQVQTELETDTDIEPVEPNHQPTSPTVDTMSVTQRNICATANKENETTISTKLRENGISIAIAADCNLHADRVSSTVDSVACNGHLVPLSAITAVTSVHQSMAVLEETEKMSTVGVLYHLTKSTLVNHSKKRQKRSSKTTEATDYSILKLTDLKGNNLSLRLCDQLEDILDRSGSTVPVNNGSEDENLNTAQSCYGTVWLVQDAERMQSKCHGSRDHMLTVRHSKQLVYLGRATDFTFCKVLYRNHHENEEKCKIRCSNPVNSTDKGNFGYCRYHLNHLYHCTRHSFNNIIFSSGAPLQHSTAENARSMAQTSERKPPSRNKTPFQQLRQIVSLDQANHSSRAKGGVKRSRKYLVQDLKNKVQYQVQQQRMASRGMQVLAKSLGVEIIEDHQSKTVKLLDLRRQEQEARKKAQEKAEARDGFKRKVAAAPTKKANYEKLLE